MKYVVLGPVGATVVDQPVRIHRAQRRAILAYLLLHANQTVTVPELIDALWGAEPPATARTQIFAGVSAVRQAFRSAGAEPVAGVRGGYRLEATADQLDLLAFDRRLDDARQQAGAGDLDRAVRSLRSAVELWDGRPLSGVSGAFVEPARAGLEERRLAALERLFELELDRGDQDSIVAELADVAAAHPYRERLAGCLMLALYRGGRPAEALAAYQRVRRTLADELGIDPGAELTTLHQRILDGDDRLRTPARPAPPTPPAPAARPDRRYLPRDIPDFTGRDADLARLDALLGSAPGTAGLVVIGAVVGVGGVGKTALAVRWAHRVASQFPDGQLYLNLRGYDDRPPLHPIAALSAVLGSLGVPAHRVPADVDEASALLRATLADQRVLLLLDNARSAEQVRPLLPASPHALVLVTSRDALGGLIARDGARRLDVDLLPYDDAVQLLTRILGPERVGADPDATHGLVATCGRLPLALRIVAAHLAMRPGQDIAGYLAEVAAGAPLESLAVEDDPRSNIRAIFDQSYRCLTGAGRRGFRLLGAVPGHDVTAEAAAALWDTDPGRAATILRDLADASLVVEHRPGRFTMHDLTREYARERAGRPGPAEALRRLMSWTVDHAESAAALLYPAHVQLPGRGDRVRFTGPEEAREWLAAELANIVAALGSEDAAEYPDQAWRLSFACRLFFKGKLDRTTSLTLGEAMLTAAARTGDLRARAAAELVMSRAYTAAGHDSRCEQHARRCLDLAAAAGWPEIEVDAHNSLSVHHLMTGDLRRAADHARQAFDLSIALGVEPPQYLGQLGLITMLMGRLAEASDCFERTLDSKNHQVGYSRGITLLNLADVRTQQGRYQEAEQHLDAAVKYLEEAGDAHVIALAKADKAVLGQYRDRAQAWQLLAEARATLEGSADPLARTQLALRTAEVLTAAGRHGDAIALLEPALDEAMTLGNRHPATQITIALARAHTAADPQRAADLAGRAVTQAREGQFRLLEGQALTVLAEGRHRQGHPEAAGIARAALHIHEETGHDPGRQEVERLLAECP